MNFLKKYYKKLYFWWMPNEERLLDKLLLSCGVDLSPEEGVFGILSQAEEQVVLERLYGDELFLALLRKYAEGANKKMIDDVKKQDWHEASRHNGQFFTYANLLRKTKKAHENQIKQDDKERRNKI